MTHIPSRLAEIIADFQFCQGREKIEMLVQYAEQMPPLPEHLRADHGSFQQVEECMTPVYVKAQLQNGGMWFFFDVPAESPTVRGFAAIMAEGLNGTSPEQVLGVPNDFYMEMGLHEVLTPQRLNGISAILAHMKRLAASALHPTQKQ